MLEVEREEEKRMQLSELNWEIKAWRDVRELGGSRCTDGEACSETNAVPQNHYRVWKSRFYSHGIHLIVELSVSFTLKCLQRLCPNFVRLHQLYYSSQRHFLDHISSYFPKCYSGFCKIFKPTNPPQMWFHFFSLQAPHDLLHCCLLCQPFCSHV